MPPCDKCNELSRLQRQKHVLSFTGETQIHVRKIPFSWGPLGLFQMVVSLAALTCGNLWYVCRPRDPRNCCQYQKLGVKREDACLGLAVGASPANLALPPSVTGGHWILLSSRVFCGILLQKPQEMISIMFKNHQYWVKNVASIYWKTPTLSLV